MLLYKSPLSQHHPHYQVVRGGSGGSDPQERCSMLGDQTAGDDAVVGVETHRGPAESSDLTMTDKERPGSAAAAARESNETVR